jgi:hypothetical protein
MNPAENYIVNQKEPYRSILLYLQAIIERTVPGLDLKYSYKIPFYYFKGKPLFYLNQTKNYVDLAFWDGNFISAHQDHLITENRKMIKSLRYFSLEEIDSDVLIAVLKNVHALRQEKYKK